MGILRCDIGRISSSFFLSPAVFNDFKQVAFSPDFVLRRPAGMSGALSFHRHLCDAFKVNLPDFLSGSLARSLLADDRLHLLPACTQHPCPASEDTMRGHFSSLLFFFFSFFSFFFFFSSFFPLHFCFWTHEMLIYPFLYRHFVHFSPACLAYVICFNLCFVLFFALSRFTSAIS